MAGMSIALKTCSTSLPILLCVGSVILRAWQAWLLFSIHVFCVPASHSVVPHFPFSVHSILSLCLLSPVAWRRGGGGLKVVAWKTRRRTVVLFGSPASYMRHEGMLLPEDT